MYREVFPEEDLVPLVQELLAQEFGVLSLAAYHNTSIVGHILFTACAINGRREPVRLLGPMGVIPSLQKQGIGSLLIKEGLRRLSDDGVNVALVLGDPNYYGRFGFNACDTIAPPYDLPAEWRSAWQVLTLHASEDAISGKLSVPSPWAVPALWLP